MAELKSLTLGGTKYDSFPARPYWVDVTITGSATDGTYSTAATAADVLTAIEAGLTPVVRATGTGDTEAYYALALIIYEAPSTGKRIYQFTRSNLVMALKEQENGSFEVTNPYEATDEVTTLPNPYKLTFTGAVSAEYDGSAAVSVEIPEGGGGGESEWRYIGEFTAADNINPWTIDADADGNPFACREFRILGSLAFFQLSSNPSANRDIGFRGDDGRWYAVEINNINNAMFPLTKADSVDGVAFDTNKSPVTMDFNSRCGILIMECAYDQYNNPGPVLIGGSMRNRGVVHTADKFTAVRVSLGYSTNLVVAGSWLKIWGR